MVKIMFKTDNAAFESAPEYEISKILREIAGNVEGGAGNMVIYDANGNKIGSATIS